MASPADTRLLYVIAYDIPDDKRRTKVHRVLCGYGQWTQFSLFECWLTRSEELELRLKLAKHLSTARDSVRFYPLCAVCQSKVDTVGGEQPHEPLTLIR
jgi:CRISPR-associated protein Cas2